jgi:aminoglycoside phosphotransferase
MTRATHPVNESIQEIDGNSWIIAGRLLLSRQHRASGQPSWSDGHGSFFVLSNATDPLPETRPLSETSELQKVYDAGAVSAVWRAGEAFIKVKEIGLPNATREHVTLDHLHRHGPLGFDIPNVHYHAEFQGRYYIVLSRLPGQTLAEAWAQMDEMAKQYYAHRVASICQDLAAWKGQSMTGVDGQHLSDLFFNKLGVEKNCDPQNLLRNCRQLGMDCSSFVFYHCDLGPGNIIVDTSKDSIGIIDWETAGFVPRDWIRTKFCFSSGMDLPVEDEEARTEWRRRVSHQLRDMGFPEVVDEWCAWWSAG